MKSVHQVRSETRRIFTARFYLFTVSVFFGVFFCMFACVQHTLGVLHYELVPTGETVFCSPLVILLDLAPCNFFGPSLLMRIELKDFCFDRLKEFQLRDKCKWTQQDYYKVVLKLGQC